MIWTLLGIFAGGMALNLTPCVYPLIPITAAYFSGRSGQGSVIRHGLLYVGGLAATNSVLGVTAALTGGLMGSLLQSPWVLVSVSGVLLFFASSLFGFWELRLPGVLTRAASRSYGGYFGSLFMGITLGVVAAPCIGPFVLGLLTWVAGLGSPWLGFLIFFVLSLGMGLPLLFLALFAGKLERLPKAGEWMVWVRKVMGWVLVLMALHFLRPLLPSTAGIFLTAALVAAAALHLGWFDRTAVPSRLFRRIRLVVCSAGLAAAVFLIGSWAVQGSGVTWKPYEPGILEEARKLGKPVIIDFSAAWCAPCRELEEITFRDPRIVKKARESYLMIKIDLTRNNPVYAELAARYKVRGVPTVVFLDRDGKERVDLRLVDYLPPDRFLARMTLLLARPGSASEGALQPARINRQTG